MPGIHATILGGDLCTADGDYAVSCGYLCEADGDYSSAYGSGSIASGEASYAAGLSTCTAAGDCSVAIGTGAIAQAAATAAFCSGSSNTCKAPYTAAFGHNNNVGIAAGEVVTPGDDGRYGFVCGTNNIVRGNTASAIGHSCHSMARLAFTQGEDNETSDRAESCVALNHFNYADARASVLIGCNNYTTETADEQSNGTRSFVQGFAAKAVRDTQAVRAGGGFTPHSQSEDTYKCYAAGDAQTSVLVFRGVTESDVENQAAWMYAAGLPGLCFGPNRGWLFNLEPDHVYAIKIKSLTTGIKLVDEAEVPVHCTFEHEAIVSVASNGTATILYQEGGRADARTSPSAPTLGTSNTSDWTFEFQPSGHGVTLILQPVGFTRTRTVAKVSFEEIATAREDVEGTGFDLYNGVLVE